MTEYSIYLGCFILVTRPTQSLQIVHCVSAAPYLGHDMINVSSWLALTDHANRITGQYYPPQFAPT